MAIFNIPEIYRPAIERMAFMPENEATAIREALASVQPSLKAQAMADQAKASIKIAVPDLNAIVQALVSMNTTRLSAGVSAGDFAKDVSGALARWTNKPVDSAALELRLVSLLCIEPLVLSARAFDVQHEYEKLFASARILTDVRPVLRTPGVEPVGAIIVHNLKITYFEGGAYKQIFIALDNGDLSTLRKVLDRAELKTAGVEGIINKTGLSYFESK